LKKELEVKHVAAMAEMEKSLIERKQQVESLMTQLMAIDVAAKMLDDIIMRNFLALCFRFVSV
jgi:hypothetical protein